jgi:hypothetical protein
MQLHGRAWMGGAMLATVVALGGCAEISESEATGDGPATLEPIAGTDVQRVTLTPQAVERLDIQTADVVEELVAGSPTPVKTIPYAAVVYDEAGDTWAYTNPEPHIYVREPIVVAEIDGERALLMTGPEAGTAVVTVGTAELFGTENEIG